MQANSINLQVDVLNNGTPVSKTYSRYEEQVNRSTYNGPNHTMLDTDTMSFYRTLPKRSGNFNGTARSGIVIRKTVTVKDALGNDVRLPLIGEVNFSVPVGVSAAVTKELRQTLISVLDADAVSGALNDALEI